jgi:hypothetical protein
MTNRIGGDYSADALEAFRSAYASQMNTPEDQDTDSRMGLPGSEISNTSPWIAHTGLWKYPSGKGVDEDLQKPFSPDSFITQSDDDDDELSEEEFDAYLNALSIEELQELAAELGIEDEASEVYEGMSDEEIENLIAEINDSEEG